MSCTTNYARRYRLATTAALGFLVLGLSKNVTRAADEICGPGRTMTSGDLTGLSLQELYNLDIVQPNVLGGHTHPAGQTMFGYEYMHVRMSGLYQGQNQISPAQAFAQGFTTVHVGMDMDMHMFEVMHAPTEDLTLMAMLPYKSMSMLHMRNNGTEFRQGVQGVGDLEVLGLYTIYGDILKGGNRIVVNAGMTFPTGAIDASDHAGGDPTQPKQQLEYPMQLGSGTFDMKPGLTYLGEAGPWSWGAQTIETIRVGNNYHDYRLGNEYNGSAWVSYGITDWVAPTLRLDGHVWENIHGADPGLAANPTPEGRPNLRAGGRIDVLFGLNFYIPDGVLKGSRLTMEGGLPVYQDLKGPQLGTAWMLSIGASYAF